MAERPFYGIAGLREHRDLWRGLSKTAKAERLAEMEACPVAPDLIAQNGAQNMVIRYGRVINWFDYSLKVIRAAGRGDLADSLATPRPRRDGEPLGIYSENWLPDNADTTAYRSASAYFVGRIFFNYLTQPGQSKYQNRIEAQGALRDAATGAESEVEMLVTFAENLARLNTQKDIDQAALKQRQITLLTRVLGTGKLLEDNQLSEYQRIEAAVRNSEVLGEVYKGLTQEELDKNKIYYKDRVERFLKPEDFGSGKITGDDRAFGLLSAQERLVVIGWWHACPRLDMVAMEYEPEWTEKRYTSCNAIYRYIAERAAKINPELAYKLVAVTPRNPKEPVGTYIPGRVPESHKQQMSALSTLAGYALPRVYWEAAGRDEVDPNDVGAVEAQTTRAHRALTRLEELIGKAQTPLELTVKIAKVAVEEFGVAPRTVLDHMFEPGILEEENNYTEFGQMFEALNKWAPELLLEFVAGKTEQD
jgi:hypothetical protein